VRAALLVAALAGCGPYIDPAAKADIDRRVALLGPGLQGVGAPTVGRRFRSSSSGGAVGGNTGLAASSTGGPGMRCLREFRSRRAPRAGFEHLANGPGIQRRPARRLQFPLAAAQRDDAGAHSER
jgi:hypothetical protein